MNMNGSDRHPFEALLDELEQFIDSNPTLAGATLANVFSMRQVGNKTHGDLAEIALTEFIESHLDDWSAKHVGKDLFRAKSKEQDILVTAPSGNETPVSLKAYGREYLQLSTDKAFTMFPYLQEQVGDEDIYEEERIEDILSADCFIGFHDVNVLPLIYDEDEMICNIMTFDDQTAFDAVAAIELITDGGGRKHPVYRFFDEDDDYIMEVRYGGPEANALQRGLWTHTRRAEQYFRSLTGWIEYEVNQPLLDLLARLLILQPSNHEVLLTLLEE